MPAKYNGKRLIIEGRTPVGKFLGIILIFINGFVAPGNYCWLQGLRCCNDDKRPQNGNNTKH